MNEIKQKAEYCLNCINKPCSQKGCPLNNDIPAFINNIKKENYKEAYNILMKTTVLPSICGRICPHYKQCMGSCVRGIKGEPVNIGTLEAFVGDMIFDNNTKTTEKKPKKIAVIGGGPAGLTSAAFLAREGYKVTIFEKYNYLGGLLCHGIPEFRLPRKVIEKSIEDILKYGIEVKYNQELNKNLNLKDLQNNYDYIILAFGANKSIKLNIEGENLNGVEGGNELLEYNNTQDFKDKIVVVNGGGNVAIDVARTAKRKGAKKVIVTYRRAREQMPAETKEIEAAINENIEFLFQHNIVRILGKENVEEVELVKTELIKKENERPIPVNIENSNYKIKADKVIVAIGSKPQDFVKDLNLELNSNGTIRVNEKGQTSKSKIYAIGDLAGNKQTVAWAARSGRDVAENIIKDVNIKTTIL